MHLVCKKWKYYSHLIFHIRLFVTSILQSSGISATSFFLEVLSLIAFKSEPSLCLAVYSTCQWFWTRWRFLSISSIQWKICLHRKNRSACLVACGALKWKPWPNLRAAYSSRNGGLIMDIHSCCGLSVWKTQLVYALNFSDGEFTEMKRKQNNKSLDNIIWHFWIIHFLI